MKCCMFGVNLNGTDSEDEMIGLFDEVAKDWSAQEKSLLLA